MRPAAIWLAIALTAMCPYWASAEIAVSNASSSEQTAPKDRLAGLKVAAYGPNCWNSALAMAGLADAPRGVTKPEMWHWLNSPYCRKLDANERPQRGDIGSLFWKDWGNYHAYTYIDAQTVFAKNGPDAKYSYDFKPYEDMFNPNYRAMAAKCKNLTSKESLSREDCEMKTVYHRCRPLPPDFYLRHAGLREVESQVRAIEDIVKPWIIEQAQAQRPSVGQAMAKLTVILKDLRGRRYTGEAEFARKSLEYRVVGLFMSGIFATFSHEVSQGEILADRIQTEERAHVPKAPDEVQ